MVVSILGVHCVCKQGEVLCGIVKNEEYILQVMGVIAILYISLGFFSHHLHRCGFGYVIGHFIDLHGMARKWQPFDMSPLNCQAKPPFSILIPWETWA